MEAKDWIDFVVAVLAGMATAIPLVYKLVQLVKTNVKERNWAKLISVTLDLMEDAELLFEEGADREQWVVDGVMSIARHVDYAIDEEELRQLIRRLCEMSKKVNAGGAA